MGKKPKKIKVVIFEPFKSPYIKEIENNVDTFQSIVDGWIDYIRLDNNIDIICNDSFLFDKTEYPNRSVFRYGHETFIFGTFFFIKTVYDNDGDYHISLSDEEIKKILSDFISIDTKIISKLFYENVVSTKGYGNEISFNSKNYSVKINFFDDFIALKTTSKHSYIDKIHFLDINNFNGLKLPKDYTKNLSYIECLLFLLNLKTNFFKIY